MLHEHGLEPADLRKRTSMANPSTNQAAATLDLGGDLTVRRLGFRGHAHHGTGNLKGNLGGALVMAGARRRATLEQRSSRSAPVRASSAAAPGNDQASKSIRSPCV